MPINKRKNTVLKYNPMLGGTSFDGDASRFDASFLTQLANVPDGLAILALDSKFKLVFANPHAYKIFNIIKNDDANAFDLPTVLKRRLSNEVNDASEEFSLQYSAGNQLRTFKVVKSQIQDETLDEVIYVFHMLDITDRIKTEVQLRHTEKLLRSLINASPDFICLKDAQGKWQEVNQSGLDFLKLGTVDYFGKSDSELAKEANPIFQDFFKFSKVSDEHVWSSGRPLREEETIPMVYGGDKTLDLIKVPLFHDDGSKQGIVVLGRDITERKLAECDLRDRSAVLDALISTDWLLHSSESWQEVSKRVLEQLSLACRFGRATLFKNNFEHPDQELCSRQLYQWSAAGVEPLGENYKQIDYEKSGCSRWIGMMQKGQPIFGRVDELPKKERVYLQKHGTESVLIIPIFSGSDWWGILLLERFDHLKKISSHELGAMLAVARSFGVAILRESSGKRLQQAKIAFDSATEGIMILDEKTEIIAINRGFTEITGFCEEDVLGYMPKELQMGSHHMWHTISTEGKWRGEISSTRKNGEPFQEWLTLTMVKNQEGKVVNYVGVFADISEIKHSQQKLHQLVNHDPLTGLPNRRLLNELLEQAIKRSERDKNLLGLLFIDLDRFKAINDTLGHHVGDKLLYEVSQRIRQAVRDSDLVSRLGGDEFVIVANYLESAEDASTIAKKIINTLQAEFLIEGREIFIGASIGISIYPKDGSDVDTLIKSADMAMYNVKNQGKNNYAFYSADLSKDAVEKFTIETQLRRALERNQFEVYYQPQVSLLTGEIIGAEALIRWNHPELGLVSPAKFIPLAEETGLIVQIGEWVLRQAAKQAMEWVSLGYPLQWISVNVSGVQILRSNFADTVFGVLIETECDPKLLELEITESTVMHNTEYVTSIFYRIKQLGVRLAIDDFGTGYSSLSHLKRLPLDKIKIDQSFVRELPHNVDDAAITHAIYAMARSLGFEVIAEGVETTEQAEFLRNMGCEQAQGYLFSRPVNAEAFFKLLTSDKS